MENIRTIPSYTLSEPIVFSKIFITGPLTPMMPYIVLSELAFENRFLVDLDRMSDPKYYIKVFKKISKIDPSYIGALNEKENFINVVHIVNPYMKDKWDIHTLQNAFGFLNYFKYVYREEKEYPFFSFTPVGLQTPKNQFNINACVYYGIARQKKLNMPLDITYEELKNKVILSLLPIPDSPLHPFLDSSDDDKDELPLSKRITHVELLKSSSRESPTATRATPIDICLRLKSSSGSDDEHEMVSKESTNAHRAIGEDAILTIDFSKDNFNFFDNFSTIESIGELFEDISYVRNQFHPINDEQAIVASALVLYRDLSKMSKPLEEFKYYKEYLKTKDSYIKEIEIHNPYFIDLHMYFNPYLPKTLYHKRCLDHHVQLFSYSSYLFIGMQPYEILQELYLEENFYLGWHPNIINTETPIELDSISDLQNQQIICYGVRDEMVHATTWKELYSLFQNMNLFINPFEKNKVFHVDRIERLNKLGRWILSPSMEHRYLFLDYGKETLDHIREFVELLDTMLLFQKSEFEMFKEYSIQYQSMSKDQRENIKMTLDKLFDLIMYMRGWKQGEPYPIDIVPPSNNEITEKNTLEALMVLDEWNNKSNNLIYSFPLIIWKNEFVKSQMEEQGLTIGERIAIVKNGESDNVNSCIRMTSNILGASYCFYCKLFKILERFDIKDLTYIQ